MGHALAGADPVTMEPDKCAGWSWHAWGDELPSPLFKTLDEYSSLKGAAQRKVEMAAFVDAALSPSYFGTGDAEALLDLVATLPDEHTELRDEMLEAIGEQLRVAARGASSEDR